MTPADLNVTHELVSAAASGRLPDWAVAEPGRREHMARVAAVMDAWAGEMALVERERVRWRAAAHLHDALRDAPPAALRQLLPPDSAELEDALLHGPAASARLRTEGVADDELLAAVAFHTLGDPSFGLLGRALYAADFLEPGRSFLVARRAELRASAPHDLDAVVLEVARLRVSSLMESAAPLHARTVAFWNTLVGESRE